MSCLPRIAGNVLLITTLALLPSHVALAQYATGGTGLHRNRIFWVDWGTNGEDVFAGKTVTRGFNIDTPATAANRLDITCQISNLARTRGSNGLFVYAPGDWRGDGLDELYNIGGNDPGDGVGVNGNPNTLTVGLRTSNASTIEFDLNCTATLGGTPFTLNGLVFADAEASANGEFVAARLTNGGVLRVIDQISQCGASTNVVVVAGPPQEVQFAGTPTHCQSLVNPPLSRGGPALVGFLDGVTSGRFVAHGSGVSAIAVGAVIELEFSEAIPTTYGNATHVLDATWSGGVATGGVNYNNPANLATFTYGVRLGATISPDQDANGAVGGPDVDALPKTSGPLGAGYASLVAPLGPAGTVYSIGNVQCVGPAAVAGWIDFNGNGVFDAAERSALANCPSGSGSVTLTWTIPTPGTVPQSTSYMRLRIAPNTADLASATGIAINGEAEDYRITIAGASLTLRKTWVEARVGDTATLQATGLSNNATLASVADSTSETDTQIAVPVFSGETAALSETLPGTNIGRYVQSLACSGASDPDLSNGLTIGAADGAIVCTFTNTIHKADLSITKTNTPGINGEVDQASDVLVSGNATSYTITLSNAGPQAGDGAVLHDTPGANLVCTTATCSATGGASCPVQTGPALMSALQGVGATVPVLPAGGQVIVVTQCQVQ